MFLVSDRIGERHQRIERFLGGEEAPIALLLSAADFERTVRRAILGLGSSSTKNIRENVLSHENIRGFGGYKQAWKDEVKPRLEVNLANDVVRNWQDVKKAFAHRNRIIHGATIRSTPEFTSFKARSILIGCIAIHQFASQNSVDLDSTIRRYKPRD
jgi:hypothetical protein